MKLKLFKKYFFITAAIIIFSLSVMMMTLSFVLNNYIASSKQKVLLSACGEVVDYVELRISNDGSNSTAIYDVLPALSEVSSAQIFVLDSHGRLVTCSCFEYEDYGTCIHGRVDRADVNRALESGEEGTMFLSALGVYENFHYVGAMPISNSNGATVGTVFATTSISDVKSLLSSITRLFLLSAAVPIILMFFAIYIMTYRLTKPLRLMSEASKEMAKGNFSKRIPVTSDDEIGELAASFNLMTNSLSQLEGMRRSFVANVSHELRTPMTTIGGFIDGILDGTIEPEREKYYLEIVSHEVKRLTRLVHSMLNMSKLESGEFELKPELFDLKEMLLTVVISQEQRIADKNLEISGLDTLGEVSETLDKDLIHQLMYILVDNAIKFTEENGKVSFMLKKEGRKTVLTVTNTGKGIPKKDIPFVFERFYKTDKSRSAQRDSMGLGLYILKTIVNAHKGEVFVMSEENEYTTFKVVLSSLG